MKKILLIAGLALGLAAAVVAQPGTVVLPSVSAYKEVIETPVTVGVKPGALVAIEGDGFGVIPGTVNVDCLAAQIVSWTPTRILIIVPPHGPTSQNVAVQVLCVSPPLYYMSSAFRILP